MMIATRIMCDVIVRSSVASVIDVDTVEDTIGDERHRMPLFSTLGLCRAVKHVGAQWQFHGKRVSNAWHCGAVCATAGAWE